MSVVDGIVILVILEDLGDGGRRLHLDSSVSQFRRPSRRERYPNRAVAGVKVRLWEGGMVAGLGCPEFRSII
jgi:hypothetical protein